MRAFAFAAVLITLPVFGAAQVKPHDAQTPASQPKKSAVTAPAPSVRNGDLPVTRVVLYKNGVGYFEHSGRVQGSQELNIDFTTGQLNDVLKSLTVVDLGGGQITGVRYNSIAPLSERLRSLRVQLGENTTREEFLNALRGARVEVRSGTATAVGKLLSVEKVTREVKDSTVEKTEIAVMTDSGELRSFELTPATGVRILEGDLSKDIGQYLAAIGTSRAKDVRRMTIGTSGTGDRNVFVSYISEVPVWKSTYRILLPTKADEKPLLQGWAIVDNTVGEDWNNVQLSLVAGAPQSFIQQISQPLYMRRPTMDLPKTAMLTPQTHEGTLEGGELELMAKVNTPPPPPPPPSATPNYNYSARSGDRDKLEGRSFQTVEVSAAAPIVDIATSKIGGNDLPATLEASVSPDTKGGQIGTLFEYALRQKITVGKNQSALVPIVSARVDAEKVTLWNPHQKVALRALWLKNTSGLMLDGGTFNIVDGDSFAGEGVLTELHPDERRIVSFAADSAVTVHREDVAEYRPVSHVSIVRGTMRIRREERTTHVYKVRNADKDARTVVVEEPAQDGWKLVAGLKAEESSENFHRFRMVVKPNATESLKVEQFHPREDIVYVSNISDDYVALLVREKAIDANTEQQLRRVLAKKSEINAVDIQLRDRNNELTEINNDQTRMRENMKALKGSAEEKALLQRYVRTMDGHEDRLIAIRKDVDSLNQQRDKLNAELGLMIERFTVADKDSAEGSESSAN